MEKIKVVIYRERNNFFSKKKGKYLSILFYVPFFCFVLFSGFYLPNWELKILYLNDDFQFIFIIPLAITTLLFIFYSFGYFIPKKNENGIMKIEKNLIIIQSQQKEYLFNQITLKLILTNLGNGIKRLILEDNIKKLYVEYPETEISCIFEAALFNIFGHKLHSKKNGFKLCK